MGGYSHADNNFKVLTLEASHLEGETEKKQARLAQQQRTDPQVIVPKLKLIQKKRNF